MENDNDNVTHYYISNCVHISIVNAKVLIRNTELYHFEMQIYYFVTMCITWISLSSTNLNTHVSK